MEEDNNSNEQPEALIEPSNELLLESPDEELLEPSNDKPINNLTPGDPIEQPIVPPKQQSNSSLLTAIISIVVVILIIVAGYIYFQISNGTKSNNVQNNSSASETSLTKTAVESATQILTDGTNDESITSNTDDTSLIDDASSSTGNVGDSIDENNL